MTAVATAHVNRVRTIPAAREEVWRHVGDLDRLALLIDGLEEMRPLPEGGHLFLLRAVHALGRRFRPGAKLRVVFTEPERVTFEPVAESADAAEAQGRLSLAPSDAATEVRLAIDVSLDLPIPRLLGGAASAILAHELRVGFDRFLDNLERVVTAG